MLHKDLGLLGSLHVGSFHEPGLAPGSGIIVNNSALGGFVDYAHSLVNERNGLLRLSVHSGLGLLHEGLDPGFGIKIARSALPRLLNVFNN